MKESHAVIAGAILGFLSPVAPLVAATFGRNQNLSWADIPYMNCAIFAVFGATGVYFLADRVRRHVFAYGIMGPFVFLSFFNSFKAQEVDMARENEAKAVETSEDQIKYLEGIERDFRESFQKAELPDPDVIDALRGENREEVGL